MVLGMDQGHAEFFTVEGVGGFGVPGRVRDVVKAFRAKRRGGCHDGVSGWGRVLGRRMTGPEGTPDRDEQPKGNPGALGDPRSGKSLARYPPCVQNAEGSSPKALRKEFPHMSDSPRPPLPSGLVVFVKRDCPTCELVVPVLEQLAQGSTLTLFCQDDPSFPEGAGAVDDTTLERSWHHAIETVPTLLAVEEGIERSRTEGWDRGEWERLSGVAGLGSDLPAFRPGCGSLSVDPEHALDLAVRFGADTMKSRRVKFAAQEDEMEAAFERGWTDGLPVVPPTERRVLAMLQGTRRKPDEVVAVVPPDLVECSVEKVAINAVMAGCRPEYLPVVLAAVEAACTEQFNMHGLLATTMPAGPVIIVNGPIRRALGMNSGRNVFGQGNRANSTIGRALQLVVRNVGGGRPGEVDRATFREPRKALLLFRRGRGGVALGSLVRRPGGRARG